MNRTHHGPPGRPSAQGGGPGASAPPATPGPPGGGIRATVLRAGRWAFTAPLRLLCTTLTRLLPGSRAGGGREEGGAGGMWPGDLPAPRGSAPEKSRRSASPSARRRPAPSPYCAMPHVPRVARCPHRPPPAPRRLGRR
ncbi:hypothetical protein CH313_11605 [Streptomyces sp. TSRI0384-2]|nr:hypothetical protein CH313_11605 [Streptomyces sp. TSRI0384-2]GFH67575.1 hypothetical protein Srut_40890 [Streptomyces rutgersensis]